MHFVTREFFNTAQSRALTPTEKLDETKAWAKGLWVGFLMDKHAPQRLERKSTAEEKAWTLKSDSTWCSSYPW